MTRLGTHAIAPGNHDGVHRGHQELVRTARQVAEARGLQTAAMFFDPHPASVTHSDVHIDALTLPQRRAKLLQKAGADEVFIEEFSHEFSLQSPRKFAEDILVGKHHAAAVIVGPDFRFGRNRAGSLDTLRTLGKELGFSVHEVAPVFWEGDVVSSSRIRRCLQEGDVRLAAALLGRVHEVTGRVVHGDQRGRAIGFPTANLECEPVLLPADGVYAVVGRRLAHPGSPLLSGVANLGVRPTFAAGRSVEVHFFDFAEDIYEESLRVGFVSHIRGERKFAGLAELTTQIERDVRAAADALASADPTSWTWLF